jgi:hypothetical protein
MLTTKKMLEGLKTNFNNILETHAQQGLPVVIGEGEKTFYLYKDGKKVEVKKNKNQ